MYEYNVGCRDQSDIIRLLIEIHVNKLKCPSFDRSDVKALKTTKAKENPMVTLNLTCT